MAKCSKCGKSRHWKLADGRLKCRQCGHRFVMPHSVWAASRLSVRTKHQLLEWFVLGVPVYRQRFRGCASAPAAERFYRLLRAVCAHQEHLRGPLTGQLELDETTFGGARHGKRGWGAAGKVIVFGILKRNGLVRVFPIPTRNRREIIARIATGTRAGSLYYTDEWQAYAALAVRGRHIVIHKQQGRPKGRNHINGIEGFWSYAKHWLYPLRGVPRRHFHLHLGEVAFRFNHREQDLLPLLERLMKRLHITDINPILVRNR
jgi:transposase